MTKGDIVVVAVALGLALLIWAAFYALPHQTEAPIAVVRVDGEEVVRVRVDGPTLEQQEVRILNGPATIEYGQGKVRLMPLPAEICPNGICWKTGWISRAGQSIVCVPNHTTVTLEGGTDGVDSILR
ncbi:MAG: NusG domain II-containing protein [Bacillota bacterium]|jgi:hypothetical protein